MIPPDMHPETEALRALVRGTFDGFLCDAGADSFQIRADYLMPLLEAIYPPDHFVLRRGHTLMRRGVKKRLEKFQTAIDEGKVKYANGAFSFGEK